MKFLKFNSLITASLLTTILFQFSCKKEDQKPEACFNYTHQTNANETVAFTNCSKNYSGATWSFGDGETSHTRSPEHTYQNQGTYQVTLVVDNDEKTDSYTRTLIIDSSPPIRMTLNSITITKWPETDNGNPWDTDGTTPDLFPKITNANRYLYLSTETYQNPVTGTPYLFSTTSGLPLKITNMEEQLYIEWYDLDPNKADDFMGSLGFTPLSRHVNGENTISFASSKFEFELNVTWEY